MIATRMFFAFLLGVITAAIQVHAMASATDSIQINQIVQRNPRQAAADAHLLLQLGVTKNDKPMQLKALQILASVHSLLGNTFVVGEDLHRGAALAIELKEPLARVAFMIAAADDLQLSGQFMKADKRYAEARTLALQSKLPSAIAESNAAIVSAALDRGLRKDIVGYATKAYELFESEGDLQGMARMLAALGVHSNDPARAIEYLERAQDLIDPAILRWDAMLVHYQLGLVLYQSKNYTKAALVLRKALRGAVDLNTPVNAAYIEYYLGRIDLGERRFTEAVMHFESAAPVFAQSHDLVAVFDTQRFLADGLSALGRKAESSEALARAQGASEALHTIELSGKLPARSSRLQAPLQRPVAIGDGRHSTGRIDQFGLSTIEAAFDAKLRETENALLREQQKRTSLERVMLVFALIASVCILLLVILFLIRQVRQKRRFANLALRDELTGLRNRRSILEFGRVQLGMNATLGRHLFVAILDLDHFKSVNDQYGHDVGDAVLINFAATCQRHLRSNHVFGRFGGEEFLLILPDTREDQVFDVFERLREVAGEIHVPGMPETHRITFSMGSAEADRDTSSIEAWIKNADAALYKAKGKGRDRCEVHQGMLQSAYDANVTLWRPVGNVPFPSDLTSWSKRDQTRDLTGTDRLH